MYNKFNSVTEYSNKGDNTSEVINLIEKLKVTLLEAENKQLEFLVRNKEKILKNYEVIQQTKLLVDSIQQRMNKSARQYGTFIKLKHAINLRFEVMAAGWKYNQSFDPLKDNIYFINQEKAISDFTILAEKLVEDEKKELVKSTNKKKHNAEIAPIYLFMILGITCIFQVLSLAYILKEYKTRITYQVQLENKVKELNVTNAELEQIAFVTSKISLWIMIGTIFLTIF